MITIGEVTSRVRNQIKASRQDAFMTDRVIYSFVMKHAKLLMRRQDNLNKLMKFNSIFQSLNFVELVEVDRVQAECKGVTSGCYFKRTKDKVPALMEGYWGPLIRSITSIDLSEELTPTYPVNFEQMARQKTFKYNTKKYYWYLNGYLYFPNLEWDAVRVEGVFEGNIDQYNCDTTDDCTFIQDSNISVPEFLLSEIEQLVVKDLTFMLQIKGDDQTDLQNINRP
jgi:hypothetical protein